MVTLEIQGKWLGTFDQLKIKKDIDPEFNHRLRYIFHHATSENDVSCPVCFENFLENRSVVLQSCNHMLHLSCLRAWQKEAIEKKPCVLCKKPDEEAIVLKFEDQKALFPIKPFELFFKDIVFNLEELFHLKHSLSGEKLKNFERLLKSLFNFVKAYQMSCFFPYSKELIKKQTGYLLQDIEKSFYLLEPACRLQIIDILLKKLNPNLFHDHMIFEMQLEITRDCYLYGHHDAQGLFVGSFLEAFYDRFYALKKAKNLEYAYIKRRFYDKAFAYHYDKIIDQLPQKQYELIAHMQLKHFAEFQKRISLVGSYSNEIYQHVQKVRMFRLMEQVLCVTIVFVMVVALPLMILPCDALNKRVCPR
jgi:hypothetical protein